ncbi:MAG: hypothetical protein HY900_35360 [Deltaproteobacteria bacterium]|nr:hypothetical protein [Deltaproteobacteria bacterium]
MPSRGPRAGRATDRAKLRQWWLIGLVLGALMINFPFLQIFNRQVSLGGFPLLFLYLTLGWGAAIAVIALYAGILGRLPPDEDV